MCSMRWLQTSNTSTRKRKGEGQEWRARRKCWRWRKWWSLFCVYLTRKLLPPFEVVACLTLVTTLLNEHSNKSFVRITIILFFFKALIIQQISSNGKVRTMIVIISFLLLMSSASTMIVLHVRWVQASDEAARPIILLHRATDAEVQDLSHREIQRWSLVRQRYMQIAPME